MEQLTMHLAETPALQVRIRCPWCRHVGALESSGMDRLAVRPQGGKVGLGVRRCPNSQCHRPVFVAVQMDGPVLIASFPPETIDFDASNLPENVLAAFDEAIRAHAAGCHRAAALMIRRTLEEMCVERHADGKNLRQRLRAFAGKVAIADALVDGLDQLRLLGNDAAHVELKDFDQIGISESSLAIEITKEVLKGVYQYAELVSRLEALKRSP